MYSAKPAIVYGFHGLDKSIGSGILNQECDFKISNNTYDWLGNGVYFWENNLARAKQYAVENMRRSQSLVKEPYVLGAVIELGNCLDLLDQKYIDYLKYSYQDLINGLGSSYKDLLPKNRPFGNADFDFKKRELDCAVIRYVCNLAKKEGKPFDSVRAAFIEGEPLYEDANFYSHNHIQLAIINPNCIKGIFLPRTLADKFEE